jgi:hypothetical protein
VVILPFPTIFPDKPSRPNHDVIVVQVHLKDPSTDVEAVFFAVDVNGNGLVSEEEFEAAVQPTIMERAEQGLPMILDEIVKDAFRKVIIESEVELAIV